MEETTKELIATGLSILSLVLSAGTIVVVVWRMAQPKDESTTFTPRSGDKLND